MADLRNQGFSRGSATVGRTVSHEIDEGLRAYMLNVYNLMAIGLGITGVVAYFTFAMAITNDPSGAVAQLANGTFITSFGALIYTSPLKWVIMLAPLGLVFFLGAKVSSMKVSTAQITFWVFAALMGMSISSIFMVYTSNSIAKVFFITSASFGALSLFGYTTKKDISGWGSFLFMGLIGIICNSLWEASLVKNTHREYGDIPTILQELPQTLLAHA